MSAANSRSMGNIRKKSSAVINHADLPALPGPPLDLKEEQKGQDSDPIVSEALEHWEKSDQENRSESLHAGESVMKNHLPRLLVAKKMQVDVMGEEVQYTKPELKPVPLTVLTTKDRGPRRDANGMLLAHTLLGDAEDFDEMQTILEHDKNDHLHLDNEVSAVVHEENNNRTSVNSLQQKNIKEEEEIIKKILEGRKREKSDRSRWLNQLHIFQRYREVRESNALRNWKRHSTQWQKIEHRISKRSKKNRKDLLMSRLGEYRYRIEERDLIEEALALLESKNVHFWKSGIRIGSELLGLTLTMPLGGPREIERLHMNEAGETKQKKVNEYQHQKKEELHHVIAMLDPYYSHSNGKYLEVVGKGFNSRQLMELAGLFAGRLEDRVQKTRKDISENIQEQEEVTGTNPANNNLSSINSQKEIENKQDGLIKGTQIVFNTNRLSFDVELGEVSTSLLTIYNRGSTACHFEWENTPRPNPLGVLDNLQRFYFYPKRGVVLPGTAFDFPIMFKSNKPGIFRESWTLKTYPELSKDFNKTIVLKGIAVETDKYKQARDDLNKMLEICEVETFAKSIVNDIICHMKPENELKKKSEVEAKNEEKLFVQNNSELHLYYTPGIFKRFLSFVERIGINSSSWDCKVSTLTDKISEFPSKEQSNLLKELNELVAIAQMEPEQSPRSMLYVIAFDALVSLADKIMEVSNSLRTKLGIPLQRDATKKFTEEDEESMVNVLQTAANLVTAPVITAGKTPQKDDPARKQTPNAGTANPQAGKKPAEAPKDGKKAAPAVDKKVDAGKKGAPTKRAVETPLPDPPKVAVLSPLVAPKPKRPNSSKGWDHERRFLESQYQEDFKFKVKEELGKTMDRICLLFEDSTQPKLN